MCKFLHAKPLHVHRDQIIFLGGLPKDVDRVVLYEELIKHNIPVINLPMVIDKFTPRVVLKTKEIAKFYIEKKFVINKLNIYRARTKKRCRLCF
jgi:hypothetical protein